jgi:hypothetical protein
MVADRRRVSIRDPKAGHRSNGHSARWQGVLLGAWDQRHGTGQTKTGPQGALGASLSLATVRARPALRGEEAEHGTAASRHHWRSEPGTPAPNGCADAMAATDPRFCAIARQWQTWSDGRMLRGPWSPVRVGGLKQEHGKRDGRPGEDGRDRLTRPRGGTRRIAGEARRVRDTARKHNRPCLVRQIRLLASGAPQTRTMD